MKDLLKLLKQHKLASAALAFVAVVNLVILSVAYSFITGLQDKSSLLQAEISGKTKAESISEFDYMERAAQKGELREKLHPDFCSYSAKGNELLSAGKPTEARQLFFRALQSLTKDVSGKKPSADERECLGAVHSRIGNCLLNEKQLQGALKECNISVSIAPSDARNFYVRARVYEAMGQKPEAEKDMQNGRGAEGHD